MRDGVGELRLLERQEDAHVTGGRVQGAKEGHEEQRPEILLESEDQPGQEHQHARQHQK